MNFYCDETRISLNGKYQKEIGIESNQKQLYSFLEPTIYPCASYIPFINNSKYYTRKDKTFTYYCFTKTRYG